MTEHYRLTQNLLAVITAFRAVNPLAPSTVSRKFLGSGRVLAQIESPEGYGFPVPSYDSWLQKFSDEWPDGATWPPHVDRPAPTRGKAGA